MSNPLLSVLTIQHPEWRPLIAAIDEAGREGERPSWTRAVPALRYKERGGQPLLQGAVVELLPREVSRWIVRVLDVRASAGDARLTSPLRRAMAGQLIDPLVFMELAITRDRQHLAELARTLDTDSAVLDAQMRLIGRPLLQACRRSWAQQTPPDWNRGYCPICGDWPVLAEVRGDDGRRRLRCGSCGGDWPGQWLCCLFCGEQDEARLGSLLSTDSLDRHSVEVCDACGGYIKGVICLTPMTADDVVLYDVTSLELDVAAVARGYHRPADKAHEVTVSVVPRPSRLRRLFGLSR